MKVKNIKPLSGFKKIPLRSFQNLLLRFRTKLSFYISEAGDFLTTIEQKLISLNIISQNLIQTPDSTNFRSSYFSRNQKKIMFSNFFTGILQTIIDMIQFFSQNNDQQINILTLILNIVLTIMSTLFLFKLSNKIVIFILVNFTRVILDITLRVRTYDNEGSFDYCLFFLNQNIVMLLMVNFHMISNSYIKKVSWLTMQFIFLILMAIWVQYLSFTVLKAFIYTYIHSILANLIINFDVGMYQEVYEFKTEAVQEKIEIEEILNIISSGILIIDFDMSQVLFANKKLLEMFELAMELTNLRDLNLKGLLEIFGKQISKITERIFYAKDDKANRTTKFVSLEKKENHKDLDNSAMKETVQDYYLNTYAKFQDLFINLKGNFDYMHKRNMSQNLSAVKSQKHLQLIIKPTVYKQKKAFFLIFNQAFEDREDSKDLNIKEKQKHYLGDNKISLSFLMELIYKLKIPLSMIISSLKLINDKKIKKSPNLVNSLICGLNYQEVFMHNIIDILIFPSENIILHSKKINLRSFFNEISENFSYLAELKNISLTTLIDDKLPPDFKSDEFKIKQIFYLLLDNAIKFSPNGGVIKIIATFKPKLKKVKFAIQDTGLGMTLDEIGKIKKILSNPDIKIYLEKGISNKIGLILCQNYILMLNKSQPFGLKVKSRENETSTFSFYLDLEKPLEKQSTNDQDIPIQRALRLEIPGNSSPNQVNVKNSSNIELPVLTKPTLISRNESGLIIDFNKSIKLQNYKISEEFQKRLLKIKEKPAAKTIQDDTNYDSMIENSPHMGVQLANYTLNKRVPTIPEKINEVSKSSNESESLLEDQKEELRCEDVLIINDNYFHLLTLETLLNFHNWKYIKYFDIQSALKMLAIKTQKNAYENLYKVILFEVGLNLQESLANLKMIKKGFSNRKIPYIPIIGYSSVENKEFAEMLIEKGLSDLVYLPINDGDFYNKISPWVVRDKK